MASQRLSSALSLVNLGGAGQGVRDSRCHVGDGRGGGVEGLDGGGTIFFTEGGQCCTLQLVTVNHRLSEGFSTRFQLYVYIVYSRVTRG